jgi:shikimate kinase
LQKNLVLLGMMGVGKSTLGKILAKKLNLSFIDTDTCIEKNCSMKISEIFRKKGEKFFRLEEEKEVVKAIKKSKSVLALGGGAFLTKSVRNNILKNCISVWLSLDTKSLKKRLKWHKKRPLLNNESKLKTINKLNVERANIYKLANYKIDCSNASKEIIVKKIINLYEKH